MRNGINVAAVSELTHEIRHVDGEHEIQYGVDLQWLGALRMQVSTRTLQFGSKKMGRDFQFVIDHHSNPSPSAAPCPVDFFLSGVGACVANILVQGASYKEINLQALNVNASAAFNLEPSQNKGIIDGAILATIQADGSNWQYKQMMINASRFSPNYMTAKRANHIELNYEHQAIPWRSGDLFSKPSSASFAPAEQSSNTSLKTGVDIDWHDGTQFCATPLERQWQDQHWSLATRVPIDQPSTALGLNSAPNPQEYLLASVAADVSQHLLLICEAKGQPLMSLSATMTCKLDMRGCFNLFDKSAVQLQDVSLQLAASSHYSEQDMQGFIELACQRSACWQSFVQACAISLHRKDN